MRVTFQLDEQVQTMTGEKVIERLQAVKQVAGDRLKIVSFEGATDDETTAILPMANKDRT